MINNELKVEKIKTSTIFPDLFESKLIDILATCERQAHMNKLVNDGNWTRLIKDSLAKEGLLRGYEICTSGFKDEYNSEWLFDMVWYKEDEQKRLIDVPLVVESEWSTNHKQIKFDFEKLLVANAEHKLMICQSYDHNKEDLEKYFYEAIQCYKLNRKGERYLIAILDKDPNVETFAFPIFEKL